MHQLSPTQLTNQQAIDQGLIGVGDKLWSSCRGEPYGTIVRIDESVMDIELADPECILSNPDPDEDDEIYFPESVPEPTYDDEWNTQKWRVRGHGLQVEGKITSLRNPYVSKIGLFKDDSRLYVEVHTPGNGCYRCDKFFSIVKKGT